MESAPDMPPASQPLYAAVSGGEPVEAARDEAGASRGRAWRRGAAALLTAVALIAIASANPGSGRTRLRTRLTARLEEVQDDCGQHEKNADYSGTTPLLSAEAKSAKECRRKCDAEPKCGAWTWGKLRNVKGWTNECFLERVASDGEVHQFFRYGVVSGVKKGLPCLTPEHGMKERSTSGVIKSRHGICLEAEGMKQAGGEVRMRTCHEGREKQEWAYDGEHGQIKNLHGICLDAVHREKNYASVQMYPCDTGNWSQQWTYDNVSGIIKNWRGICLSAGERSRDGGSVYLRNCNTNSLNQQWSIGDMSSMSVEPVPTSDPGSLFCFALMLPHSYEQELLAMQFEKRANLFGCDAYSVFSKEVIEVVPGQVTTSVVDSDLKCDKGGEFGTALNTDIFVEVWKVVLKQGVYRLHDWTVKVDPDTVFFPWRLLEILRIHPEDPRGTYLNNCKFGMHGPLEVFSHNAVQAWAAGWQHCVEHFRVQCDGDCFWGEDLFIDQCLWKVLKVRRDNDFRLLREDHCEPPKGWRSCTDESRAAFHPFKNRTAYLACLGGAQKTETKAEWTWEYNAAQKAAEAEQQAAQVTMAPAPVASAPVAGIDAGDGDVAAPAAPMGSATAAQASPGGAYDRPAARAAAPACKTALQGDPCYEEVQWAREFGIYRHRSWYPGLHATSSFEEFQTFLHEKAKIRKKCPLPPCSGQPKPSMATR